jgi:hypothetical protein
MLAKVCIFLFYCFLMATSGCDRKTESAKLDACTLITSAEIQEVQGEAVKETKSNERAAGAFNISQCFYTLPTFNKSISLEVTRNNNSKGDGPKEFWKKRFHGASEAEREEEEERAEGKGSEGKEEKEEEGKPIPVDGVGDEAYWSGNRRAGALYVLKNDSFIRISIGGPEDETVKINKSKTLAQKALQRF